MLMQTQGWHLKLINQGLKGMHAAFAGPIYLAQLMAALEKNDQKLYKDISHIPSRHKCVRSTAWLFCGGCQKYT